MGAWGAGNFENDTALDWVSDLKTAPDLEMVEEAVSDVLGCDDYLDADQACTCLAAAEVVAALKGKPAGDLPEDVSEWVRAHGLVPEDALVRGCRGAMEKIRSWEGSELKELWEEAGDHLAEWHAVLDDLASRLQ